MDKDKLKGMLKISERDKKLLIVVMAVLIMALAYFFGYSNLSSQVDTLSNKKTSLEVTKKDLKEKNNNKEEKQKILDEKIPLWEDYQDENEDFFYVD